LSSIYADKKRGPYGPLFNTDVSRLNQLHQVSDADSTIVDVFVSE